MNRKSPIKYHQPWFSLKHRHILTLYYLLATSHPFRLSACNRATLSAYCTSLRSVSLHNNHNWFLLKVIQGLIGHITNINPQRTQRDTVLHKSKTHIYSHIIISLENRSQEDWVTTVIIIKLNFVRIYLNVVVSYWNQIKTETWGESFPEYQNMSM